MPALCSADKTSYITNKNDYVSKKFIKNYILIQKLNFRLHVTTFFRVPSFTQNILIYDKL